MSQHFYVHPDNPQVRLISQAVQILQNGGVIVYPTDSGYALGCQMGAGAGLFLGFAVGQIPFLHCCSVFRVAVLAAMITGVKKKATLDVAFFPE
jgi:hypothetical protein